MDGYRLQIVKEEAFRVSMKELIEKGSVSEAHPSQWAPFVVVGEGAATSIEQHFRHRQQNRERSAGARFGCCIVRIMGIMTNSHQAAGGGPLAMLCTAMGSSERRDLPSKNAPCSITNDL